jgi:uncharacterized protein YraI
MQRTILAGAIGLVLVFGTMPTQVRSQGGATPTGLPCTIEIIRDEESLTVYIAGNRCVSLAGLTFEVTLDDGSIKAYTLEQYSSFKGLKFANLPVPICLRLEVRGARGGFPDDCLSGNVQSNRRLRHIVSEADLFWYSKDAAQGVLLTVLRDGELIDICPAGQARCVIEVPPAPPTPTPLPQPTSTPPDASKAAYMGTVGGTPGQLNVRTEPRLSGLILFLAPEGATLGVIGRNADGSWLWVEYEGKRGWVAAQFVVVTQDGLPVAISALPDVDSVSVTAVPAAVYPCNATITTARGTVLNVVTEFASGGNTKSVRAGQAIIILGKTPPSAAIPKYQIRDVATGRDLGWIAAEYVVLSPSCPKGQ